MDILVKHQKKMLISKKLMEQNIFSDGTVKIVG